MNILVQEILGEYINIKRVENFHDEGINKDIIKSSNKDNNNSGGNIEGEKIKSRFDSFVEDIEKNIDEFLIA